MNHLFKPVVVIAVALKNTTTSDLVFQYARHSPLKNGQFCLFLSFYPSFTLSLSVISRPVLLQTRALAGEAASTHDLILYLRDLPSCR